MSILPTRRAARIGAVSQFARWRITYSIVALSLDTKFRIGQSDPAGTARSG